MTSESKLKKESDKFMYQFDAEEKKKKEEALILSNIPDKDGFVKGFSLNLN